MTHTVIQVRASSTLGYMHIFDIANVRFSKCVRLAHTHMCAVHGMALELKYLSTASLGLP